MYKGNVNYNMHTHTHTLKHTHNELQLQSPKHVWKYPAEWRFLLAPKTWKRLWKRKKEVIKTRENKLYERPHLTSTFGKKEEKKKKTLTHTTTTTKNHNIHLRKKENKTRAMPHTVIKKEDWSDCYLSLVDTVSIPAHQVKHVIGLLQLIVQTV